MGLFYMGLFSFFYIQTVRQAPFIEDAFFFPLYIFGVFVKDQVTVSVWFYFWVFNSIPLISMSVSIPIPCSFYHCCSVIQLEVRDGDYLRSCFIVKKSFASPCFLLFQMNLQIALSNSMKN